MSASPFTFQPQNAMKVETVYTEWWMPGHVCLFRLGRTRLYLTSRWRCDGRKPRPHLYLSRSTGRR